MKTKDKQDKWVHLPKLKWKWLLAWLVAQPLAAAPLVLIVAKVGPFAEPFVANGPVLMPVLLLAVAPVVLLLHGSGIADPVSRE
jgi:hypothetical protein